MPVRVSVQFAALAGVRVPGGRPALRRLVARAVRATLGARGADDAELSVTFLDDPGMADLNRRYLRHSGPTDVISFPLYGPGESVVGDVYVGLEQAMRQAAALGIPLSEEIARLAVHGTLHVLGMDHPAGPRRKTGAMWRLQERIVRELRSEP